MAALELAHSTVDYTMLPILLQGDRPVDHAKRREKILAQKPPITLFELMNPEAGVNRPRDYAGVYEALYEASSKAK